MYSEMFMLHNRRVYVVRVPHTLEEADAYDYARKELGAKSTDITPWQWVEYKGGVAKFDYSFKG